MFELMGTVLGSVLSGGATGLIGMALQRYADYRNKKLDMELEKQRADNAIALKRVDMEIMDREWKGRVQVAQTEGETAKDVADSQAFAASFQMEPQRYSEAAKLTPKQQWIMVLLDAVRGVIRPALTVYLCLLTTYVWYQVKEELGTAQLTDAAAMEIWKLVVGTILYLTTTCILWWFGTRNKQNQPGV